MGSAVNFANLSIVFGKKELLDYKEVVSAAFLKDTHIRKYGKTSYHFLDTALYWYDSGDPLSLVLAGQFVKTARLEREQVLHDRKLIKDEMSIETSPSAFFVLFLADHRLAYLPETKYAPPLSALEATIDLFVKREFKNFVDAQYRRLKAASPSYTRDKVFEEHSPPTVKLVPLASKESIDSFIRRFNRIKKITVHIIERNQDINGGAIFESLLKKSKSMDATSSKFIATGGQEGLDIAKTKEFVAETAAGGYEDIALNGSDPSGATLNGTNDDFKMKVDIEVEGLSKLAKIKKIAAEYISQKAAGVIRVTPRDPEVVGPKLRDLIGE